MTCASKIVKMELETISKKEGQREQDKTVKQKYYPTERKTAAERDRQRLFAQALIQGPSRLRLPFTNLCLSFSHPHLRPSFLSLADHS